MKPKSFYLTLVFGCCSLLLFGCAHEVCLKAVDANTGKPLPGVSTSMTQIRFSLFQTIKREGPTNLPPSGEDGIIKIRDVHSGWHNIFVVSCAGYSNVYANCQFLGKIKLHGQMGLAFSKANLPLGAYDVTAPDYFLLKRPRIQAPISNGCYIIPMGK